MVSRPLSRQRVRSELLRFIPPLPYQKSMEPIPVLWLLCRDLWMLIKSLLLWRLLVR